MVQNLLWIIIFLSNQSSSTGEDCLKSGNSSECCADFFMKEGKCTLVYTLSNQILAQMDILDQIVISHVPIQVMDVGVWKETASARRSYVTQKPDVLINQPLKTILPTFPLKKAHLQKKMIYYSQNKKINTVAIISIPKRILDDDGDINNDIQHHSKSEEKQVNRNETIVQMRKDKVDLDTFSKRKGKTSSNISGYIDMGKKDPKDYVSMNAENIGL
uniref:Uncharacterized protein n=1 Tax=Magallana gigas TaxID=29159 RepID=A0A8W8L5S1_MAGGI